MIQAAILGHKGHQDQMFTDKGVRIPVTNILTHPCYLIDIKRQDRDRYWSLLLGHLKVQQNKNRPQSGKLKKAGVTTPLRFLKEIRLDHTSDSTNTWSLIEQDGKKGIALQNTKVFIGDELKPSVFFKEGTYVAVTGVSKGKGFQGVVRRHRFAGGPRTHGQSDRERAPGSIGQTTTPGRVYRGKRMAGRMGGDTITVRGLQVVKATNDVLVVKGVVPGSRGTLLTIVQKG